MQFHSSYASRAAGQFLIATGPLQHPPDASQCLNFSMDIIVQCSVGKENTFIDVLAFSRSSSGSCVLFYPEECLEKAEMLTKVCSLSTLPISIKYLDPDQHLTGAEVMRFQLNNFKRSKRIQNL